MNIETLANVLLLLTIATASGAWYAFCRLNVGTRKLQADNEKLERGVRDLLRMHFDAERARVVPSEDSEAARKSWEELIAENDSLHRKLDMREREKSVLIAQNETLTRKVNESRDALLRLRSQGKQLQDEVAQMKARHA